MRRMLVLVAAMATAASLLAVPGVARGQNALGDGRLLDNNLQVGSGGVNAPAAAPDTALRNNLITGNVTGLGYFHDRVNYRSPGELRVRTGSDDLFRFQARSFPTGSVPGGQPNQSLPAFRTFAHPIPAATQYGTTRDVLLRSDGLLIPISSRPIGRPDIGTQADTPFGISVQPDGRVIEMRASPLLGLRIAEPPLTDDRDAQRQQQLREAEQLSGFAAVPGAPDMAMRNQIQPIEVAGGGRAFHPAFVSPPGQRTIASARPLDTGVQTPQQIEPQRVGGPLVTVEQRIAQLQTAMATRQGTVAQPGDDVYLDVLAQLRQVREAAAAGDEPPPDQLVPPPAEGDEKVTLEPPTLEQQREAEIARIRAVRTARGLPEEPTPEEQEMAEDLDESPVAIEREVERLLRLFKRNLPPLPTMAGRRDDRVNRLLAEAEGYIREGNYFKAERAYRQVLAWSPEHGLAKMGLVHSQMGAGLMRTAELSIRAVLEQHPEVIPIRYQSRLLPPEERIKWVRNQLEDMMQDDRQQKPSVLLAYMGYQFDSPPLTRYALDVAQSSEPRNPLIPLLRRLWLPDDYLDTIGRDRDAERKFDLIQPGNEPAK